MRGILKARREAQRLLAEHRVRRAPVDVHRIASHYAKIAEHALDPDVSGVVAPAGDKWIILVNREHPPVRQRFTMAHELGHIILHEYTAPHADRTFRFRDARASEGSVLEEVQANQFAAELLMPEELVRKQCSAIAFDHAATSEDDERFAQLVAELARCFNVSAQAMTIRLSSLFA